MQVLVEGHVEPFRTIKQASLQIGVPYWLLLGVVKRGEIPVYRLGNSRNRVRVSEIISYMERMSLGDAK